MRKTCRRALVVLRTLFLCLACVSANGPVAAQIIGRWRSLETSHGGIGTMYEFHPDGVVDFSPGAVVELPWRIEANELVLPSDTANGAERRSTIKWIDPNKFQLLNHNGPVVELARAGRTGQVANPILGEWIGMEDVAGRKLEMHWFFYTAGKGLFLLPFLIQHGRYTVSGSTLTTQMEEKAPIDLRFDLKDKILTVTQMDGSEESRFAPY